MNPHSILYPFDFDFPPTTLSALIKSNLPKHFTRTGVTIPTSCASSRSPLQVSPPLTANLLLNFTHLFRNYSSFGVEINYQELEENDTSRAGQKLAKETQKNDEERCKFVL